MFDLGIILIAKNNNTLFNEDYQGLMFDAYPVSNDFYPFDASLGVEI